MDKLQEIRLAVENLQREHEKKAENEAAQCKGTAYLREVHFAEACGKILEIIDGHINLTLEIGSLDNNDIGRRVIYTSGKTIQTGRLRGWDSRTNDIYVFFGSEENDYYSISNATRCKAEDLRFESADRLKEDDDEK